jgi:putative PIN family toxin of toxin-antitoxin system
MTMPEAYFVLLLSRDIWDEYVTVTNWLTPPTRTVEKDRVLHALHEQAVWVEPSIRLEVCSDSGDNRFLECAVAGKAHYLVTKNIRHFPKREYKGIRIVRIRDFLDALEEERLAREKRTRPLN